MPKRWLVPLLLLGLARAAAASDVGSCENGDDGPTLLVGWCKDGNVYGAVHLGNVLTSRTSRDVRSLVTFALDNRVDGDVYSVLQLGLANRVRGESLTLLAAGVVGNYHGEFRGAQLSVLFNRARSVRGAQLAMVLNHADLVKGVQLNLGAFVSMLWASLGAWRTGDLVLWRKTAVPLLHAVGLGNRAERFKGLQVAGVVNHVGVGRGVQIGALNRGGTFGGVQLGVLNVANDGEGVQLAGLNYAGEFGGIQLGAANHSGDGGGVQVGVVNHAGSYRGVQVGVINRARELKGLQLGVLNFAGNGFLQQAQLPDWIPFPVFNVGW